MARSTLAAAFLLAAVFSGSASAAFINGSFEQPDVTDGSFQNFAGGSTAITGWTVVGVDSAVVDTAFSQYGINFQAQDGRQWLDLAGVTSNSPTSGVTQDVATIAGESYNLSFWIGSATDGQFFFPTIVDLSINGGARVSYTNPTAPTNQLNWLQVVVPYLATSATTNFTFYNGDQTGRNYNTAIDNISLTQVTTVPEPSPVFLLLAGVVGFVVLRRREAFRRT